MKKIISIAFIALALPVIAEEANYGRIELAGLARDRSWPHNPAGVNFIMVCNVNGPDGYLTVRSGPSIKYKGKRKFNRLATLSVDTRQRKGHWVRVVGAGRQYTKDGIAQKYKELPVTAGWAHDGYLCNFLDY